MSYPTPTSPPTEPPAAAALLRLSRAQTQAMLLFGHLHDNPALFDRFGRCRQCVANDLHAQGFRVVGTTDRVVVERENGAWESYRVDADGDWSVPIQNAPIQHVPRPDEAGMVLLNVGYSHDWQHDNDDDDDQAAQPAPQPVFDGPILDLTSESEAVENAQN